MKKYLLILIMLSQTPMLGQISFGVSQKINDQWKFILDDDMNFKNVSYNDGNWEIIDLPHDWSIKYQLSPTLASATGYLPGGIGWYRKDLAIPLEKKGEKVFLYFEGVYNRSEVFVNGVSLGKRPNGYISFVFDATPYIKYGEQNTVAVRVDHSKSADSRWYTGSGIYRDVWVVYSNPIHINQWGVYAYPELNTHSGILNVEVEAVNETDKRAEITVCNELINQEGVTVTKTLSKDFIEAKQSNTITAKLKVRYPKLWSLETPNLYQLKTTILKGGKQIDQTLTQTGFREFTFDPDKGFALNGKWMKMKGVCLHHDAGVLGAAVPQEVLKTRLGTLKEIGVNAIRTSHNPQSPDFYRLCDELGLLVLNEAYDEWEYPKRKWIEGWNVGRPGFEGSYDIFADWSEKDLEAMVRRDRNHLSVFAWSIGNEVDYPNDPYSHPVLDGGANTGFSQAVYGGYKKDAPDAMRLGVIAKRLAATVKKFDTSRPVTAGLAGVAMSNETEYPGILDITGYNYTESKYDTDHKKYPNRIIYGSETGNHIGAWLAVKNREHIFGQFVWTGIDYLGESGAWPSRGFYSGMLDFKGSIKPRGYFRQSLWSDKPMTYIGTYVLNPDNDELSIDAWPIWNYKEGQIIRVVCYTNAPKACLKLNGEIVGAVKPYDEKTGIIAWDIPFQEGKLEVIGLDHDDEQISNYTITTSKRPHALKAKVDKSNMTKEKGIAQILVEIVDENGLPVILSDNEITCTISGPAKLLGLEAANNADMTDYTDNTQRAFHGEILAYVQTIGKSGTVHVEFTSPWLEPVSIMLEVK